MRISLHLPRKLLSIGLKICVSLLFLAYLVEQVEWVEVWRHLKGAHVPYMWLYVLLGFVMIVPNAVKWRVLAEARGIRAPVRYLVSLYLIGAFFNNFLPTSVGGDVVRGYALGKAYGRFTDAMASVFVERFVGYTVLVVFGLMAIALDQKLRVDIRLVAPITIAVVVYVGILWMILNESWLRLARKWLPVKTIQKCLAKISEFHQVITLYRHEPTALLKAGGYSMLFYFLSVVTVYVGCLTFHAAVSFVGLLAAVPVLLILFMVPFSLGGIGLQEWAYFYVLTTVGVPAPASISLALLFRLRSIAFGLIGGAIYPFVTFGEPILAKSLEGDEEPHRTVHNDPVVVVDSSSMCK
jgi:glycosyltransferase 2 family protein